MADRYTYLPSLGPFIIMGLAAARASSAIHAKKIRWLSFALICSIIILTASGTYLTFRQIAVWNNTFALWDYAIKRAPESIPFAYNNRGFEFEKRDLLDLAIRDYDKAIELKPSYSDAYNNRGIAYSKANLFDKAIESFDRAMEIDPNRVKTYSNRGNAYCFIGQYGKALEDFNTAVLLGSNDPMTYYNRGSFYRRTGKNEPAVADFQKACDLGNERACSALHQLTQGVP
jgi:tetratricopeptide (TPR) repeat protein